MANWRFEKGLHDLGNGCYAYLQPDGTWGWSNAGLIVDSGQSLLVDTLFNLPLTAEMLAVMRRSVPEAKHIETLVNTHANGDHTFGNQLVEGAQIISAQGCYDDIARRPPEVFVEMLKNWRQLGEAGAFMHEVMGSRFNFDGIVCTLPTKTFTGTLDLKVGNKDVHLVDVGPAHTNGDVLIHVPADRTVYTGDILFVGGHPAIWVGPVANWIRACDLILSWDIETVVPGHGPISDKSSVRELKNYLEYMTIETRKRYDAGMTSEEAGYDIALGAFDDWSDRERIVLNTYALYREFSGDTSRPDAMTMFGQMARYHKFHQAQCAHDHKNGHHDHCVP